MSKEFSNYLLIISKPDKIKNITPVTVLERKGIVKLQYYIALKHTPKYASELSIEEFVHLSLNPKTKIKKQNIRKITFKLPGFLLFMQSSKPLLLGSQKIYHLSLNLPLLFPRVDDLVDSILPLPS